MSIAKYTVAQNTTENPRQTEYRLFAVVTKSLLASNSKERRDPEFFKAVDWNRRLWLTLQADLMDDNNAFSDSLKAQIISLAIWVDKHSRKAIRGDATLDALISVNRTIMEGLATIPGASKAS